MDRSAIAGEIAAKLRAAANEAGAAFRADGIGHFIIDDLLPRDVARAISAGFPERQAMTAKGNLRESKAVTAQVGACNPIIADAIFAFQDRRVVQAIADITGIGGLSGDPHLYAGGISSMIPGDFLNPHLDNSHDKDRKRWRALNLLYYVADRADDAGGDLELWPDGVRGEPVVIASCFNRLVVMATHGASWHSVSPVRAGVRQCVSNYYFTPAPMREADRFHVTSFRGRPGRIMADIALRADSLARAAIRRVKPSGVGRLTHINTAA